MSIKQDLDELQQINTEIARLSKSLRQLRSSKSTIESRISSFLEKEDIPAVKDRSRGVIAVLNKKPHKVFGKPRKERDQEAVQLLMEAGVKNPSELYDRIKNVGRNEIEKKVLRINKL